MTARRCSSPRRRTQSPRPSLLKLGGASRMPRLLCCTGSSPPSPLSTSAPQSLTTSSASSGSMPDVRLHSTLHCFDALVFCTSLTVSLCMNNMTEMHECLWCHETSHSSHHANGCLGCFWSSPDGFRFLVHTRGHGIEVKEHAMLPCL
jgi:hypothetical protein